jgi:hypothetical protein
MWSRVLPVLLVAVAGFVTTLVALSPTGADLRGDVNNDGRVDPVDAALILQADAGIAPLPTIVNVGTPTQVPTPDRSLLSLPADFSISRTGCSAIQLDPPYCIPQTAVAVYSGGTHEAILKPTTQVGGIVEMHETCHAHQNYTTDLAGVNFGDWLNTEEGLSYSEAAAGETGAFRVGQDTTDWLENFAGSCALYYVDPANMALLAPVTYAWLHEHLP